MPKLVVALGGNLGAVDATFVCALEEFGREGFTVLACSGLIGSKPWPDGAPLQPLYTNACVLLRTGHGPWASLRRLKRIERRLGRTKKRERNAARELDLDLVVFATRRMRHKRLTLPHPRAHLRAFVLAPLCAVAPQWRLGWPWQAPARSWLCRQQNSTQGLVWWRLSWTHRHQENNVPNLMAIVC